MKKIMTGGFNSSYYLNILSLFIITVLIIYGFVYLNNNVEKYTSSKYKNNV